MRLATKKALLASIEHWRQNEKAKSLHNVQLERTSCALCQRFGYTCERTTPKTTELCPVAKATGRKGCLNTPYSDAYEAEQIEDLPAFRAAARRERKFLESLLPSPTKQPGAHAMTRKHFNALASALRAARPSMPREAFLKLLNAVADICASSNPGFQRSKFFDAVMED